MTATIQHPSQISIEDYSYELPDEKIARYPLKKRDESKLLVYNNKSIIESNYSYFDTFIPEKSLLLFNEAKVVHARLHFKKKTGGKLELFCLEPDERYSDITKAMNEENSVYWKCFIKGATKWKDDSPIYLESTFFDNKGIEHTITVEAKKIERNGATFIIQFLWHSPTYSPMSFSELLDKVGVIPIPPYLKRASEQSDEDRYQTIFARNVGSVAAPTASLHFTDKILTNLQTNKIDFAKLTLHVGAGTFMPVKSKKMENHTMHSEWIEVALDFLRKIKKQLKSKEKIVAVGTTSARTLESAYWIGNQIAIGEWSEKKEQNIAVDQWCPYKKKKTVEPLVAIQSLINFMEEKKKKQLITRTQLIIAPGYEFKLLDGLVTNFHQPCSTLLLMIAALVGEDWYSIYDYALNHKFRFLSYGDGSLLWR